MNTTLLTELFEGGSTPLIRTDFSDNDVWERVAAAVSAPVDFGTDFDGQLDDEDDGYAPNVTPISDPSYDGVTGEALAAALTTDAVGYVLLADQQAIADAEDLTVAYVDLNHEPGRTFRRASLRLRPSSPTCPSPTWTSRSSRTTSARTAFSEASKTEPQLENLGAERSPAVWKHPMSARGRATMASAPPWRSAAVTVHGQSKPGCPRGDLNPHALLGH